MAMQVIEPVEYTYGMLTSSNVPEADYPVWVAPAVRSLGDQVIYNHKVYKAMVALTATTDVNPETGTAADTKWLLMGATNRWRMFDDMVGTVTSNPGSIEVLITPGSVVTSVAMFNVLGSSVSITVEDPVDGVVYTYTEEMTDPNDEVTDWYSYFFAPFSNKSDFIISNLPPYSQASVRVVVTAPTGVDALVGSLALGVIEDIGVACYGSSIGILDYTKKDIDEFGNVVTVERGYSKFGDFDIDLDTEDVSRVQKMMADLRAKPCVWIGYANYESTIIYGYYKDFTATIDGPIESSYNLRIEGLV